MFLNHIDPLQKIRNANFLHYARQAVDGESQVPVDWFLFLTFEIQITSFERTKLSFTQEEKNVYSDKFLNHFDYEDLKTNK